MPPPSSSPYFQLFICIVSRTSILLNVKNRSDLSSNRFYHFYRNYGSIFFNNALIFCVYKFSHNLRALYDEIKRVDTSLQLERKDLALLKDYYYDARYPGDNFVIVTVDELREALEIMLDVVEAVNCWRTSHELEILIADPRGEFQSAMSRLK